MDYRRLRAEYDAAFDRLRRADYELRSIRQLQASDKEAEEAAWQRFDQAMAIYRACRKSLADVLLSRQPAARPAVTMGSQSLGVWTLGTAGRTDAPSDTGHGRRDEVQGLVHRLSAETGRPVGKAEEHWYRAEEMIRSGQ